MNFPPNAFLNGWLWPLFLVALLPLLLHILDRRRARRIDWPAVRFFRIRSRSKRRWLQLREVLLLATRTAVLLAIAYALLRPQTTAEVRAIEVAAPRGIVLVVDTSYSMAFRPSASPSSIMERAKDNTLRLIDKLRPGDELILLVGGGELREVTSDPLDHAAARRAILALHCEGGVFDLLRAVDRATGAASRLSTASRRIFVCSDLQANSVSAADEERWSFVHRRLSEARPNLEVTLLDLGDEHPVNHFAASLVVEDILASTHEELNLLGKVATPANGGALRTRFFADGKLLKEESISQTAGVRKLECPHRVMVSGSKRFRLELESDGLREDDSRYLALDVHERIDVLIVENRSGERSPGRYVRLALSPEVGDVRPPVLFRPRLSETLDRGLLGRCRLLVLADVPAVSPEEAALVEEHVSRGGGLLIFVGPDADTATYDRLLFRGGRGPLPARPLRRTSSEVGPLYPSDLAISHPALAVFRQPTQGDLGRVQIRAYWQVSAEGSAASAVLARVGRASPWIVVRPFGSGRAAMVTTSASPADSDLPHTPLFLPLVQRLSRYLLAGSSRDRNVLVGETLRFPLPDLGEASLELEGPDGETREVTVSRTAGRPVATSGATFRPGFYRLQVVPSGGPTFTLFGAVNVSPQESRLERLDEAEIARIEELPGFARQREWTAPGPADATIQVEAEHWPYALGLALALLLAELCFLRHFARGRAAWQPEAKD